MWCSGGAGPETVAVTLQPAEQPGQGRHLCGLPVGHHLAEPGTAPAPGLGQQRCAGGGQVELTLSGVCLRHLEREQTLVDEAVHDPTGPCSVAQQQFTDVPDSDRLARRGVDVPEHPVGQRVNRGVRGQGVQQQVSPDSAVPAVPVMPQSAQGCIELVHDVGCRTFGTHLDSALVARGVVKGSSC